MAWWTLLLKAPIHLFSTNASFAGLAQHGTEQQWGNYTGAVVVMAAIALCVGSPIQRLIASVLAAFVWEFISIHLAISAYLAHQTWHGLPINTGWGIYLVLSILSVRAAMKLMKIAGNDLEHLWGRSKVGPFLGGVQGRVQGMVRRLGRRRSR